MKRLDDILSREARLQRFTLRENDDHILELCLQGKVLARFSQTGATIENILKATQEANRNRRRGKGGNNGKEGNVYLRR